MSGQINRAEQLWINWHQKQQMLEGIFGAGVAPDSKQKLDFLSAGVQRISPTASPDEKLVLALIEAKIGKLEKQLYPNVVVRLLHKIRSLLFDKPLQALRMKALKSENLQALGEKLRPLGLDVEKLSLSTRMDYERPQVKIELSSHYSNGRELSVTLNLEKDTQQHYQLIGFNASLPDESAGHKSISLDFLADSGITVPEAAKLLEGRSVLKPDSGLLGSEQGKWLQLDKGLLNDGKHLLTAFSAGDFALGEQLASLSIRLKRPELADDKILRAMESGAQVSIKAVTGEEVYLEANSAARSIVFRDSAGKECTEKQVREKDKRRQQQLHVEQVVKVERNNTKKQQQAQGLSIG